MHKDIFIFQKEHEEKAQKISDLFLENAVRNNYEGIICICGISGTGKSEIAWWVARNLYKLGISNHVVNLDRFYKVNSDVRNKWRKEKGYVGHEEMDWMKIEKELYMFDNNDTKVLIFEGLYAGYIEGLTFMIDGNIETTDDFRKLRGKEDEEDKFRQWVVGEEYADILRGTRFYDYNV